MVPSVVPVHSQMIIVSPWPPLCSRRPRQDRATEGIMPKLNMILKCKVAEEPNTAAFSARHPALRARPLQGR